MNNEQEPLPRTNDFVERVIEFYKNKVDRAALENLKLTPSERLEKHARLANERLRLMKLAFGSIDMISWGE
jgi:hypothetical protein